MLASPCCSTPRRSSPAPIRSLASPTAALSSSASPTSWRARSAAASRSASPTSTSTTSSASTTTRATSRATRSSSRPPRPSARPSGPATWPPGWAATSSPSSSPTPNAPRWNRLRIASSSAPVPSASATRASTSAPRSEWPGSSPPPIPPSFSSTAPMPQCTKPSPPASTASPSGPATPKYPPFKPDQFFISTAKRLICGVSFLDSRWVSATMRGPRRNRMMLSLLAALVAASAPAAPAADTAKAYPFPVEMHALPNGLRVAFIQYDAPGLVAYYTLMRVGSRNEVEKGRSGFAHFFEHMVFRGTKQHSAEQYTDTMTRLGLDTNAFTSEDMTVYHLYGPAKALPTIIEYEADRFQNPSYHEPAFRTEVGAILGEYIKSASNPEQKMEETMMETAFTRHTYAHTVIGYLK